MVARPKVLLADDHTLIVQGLASLLRERAEIVEIVNDGSLVLEAVLRCRPDVVILDMSMPEVSGLEAIRQIRAHYASAKIIVLTMCADAEIAVEALREGASGFLLKTADADELLTALTCVLRGESYLTASLTKDVVTVMLGNGHATRLTLTAKQQEVLRLICRGRRAKEVAATLHLSPRTIVAIKQKLMQALGVHSTAELVREAVERRLVRF
jgi:DNA-binding NarL/FixJ family response regulator